MAYVPTVTVKRWRLAGRWNYRIEVVETGAGPASEWSTTELPPLFTITSYVAKLTTGTGTTILPALGASSGFTTTDTSFISQQDTAAAYINDQTPLQCGTTGTLYGQSTVSTGSDNTINTVILAVEGAL